MQLGFFTLVSSGALLALALLRDGVEPRWWTLPVIFVGFTLVVIVFDAGHGRTLLQYLRARTDLTIAQWSYDADDWRQVVGALDPWGSPLGMVCGSGFLAGICALVPTLSGSAPGVSLAWGACVGALEGGVVGLALAWRKRRLLATAHRTVLLSRSSLVLGDSVLLIDGHDLPPGTVQNVELVACAVDPVDGPGGRRAVLRIDCVHRGRGRVEKTYRVLVPPQALGDLPRVAGWYQSFAARQAPRGR